VYSRIERATTRRRFTVVSTTSQEIVEQVDESEHLKQKIEREPIPDALPPPHPDKSAD